MLWETKPNPFILKSYQHVDDVEGGAGILLRVSLNPAGAFEISWIACRFYNGIFGKIFVLYN